MIKSFEEDAHPEEQAIVLPFYGAITSIPEGWALADGSLGTVNASDRFIRGLSNYGSSPGSVGGSNEVSLSNAQMKSHRHNSNVQSGGSHRHRHLRGSNMNTNGSINLRHSANDQTASTQAAGSHSHPSTNTVNAGTGSDIDNRPRFAELAFIQKL